MTFGALSFLSPLLLGALLALPVIYWLLRTTPPRPRQIRFPATRILVGLENKEKTPDTTPWWLMLIRMLAAAAVIFALAEPVLNPDRAVSIGGAGPVAIVVDNGWSSGAKWGERQAALERTIGTAESAQRPVVILATAPEATKTTLTPIAPADARRRAAALAPQPYAPDRPAALERLRTALQGQSDAAVVWLSDGIDHGAASGFASGLAEVASGGLTVIAPSDNAALGVHAALGEDGGLVARIVRAGGGVEEGLVHALSQRGERLSEARFKFNVGQREVTATFDLPLELRNQVSRVAISGERSAGAVQLLDARTRWNRVGLMSGASQEQSQPLLGPLYYIRRALTPFSEVISPAAPDATAGIDLILKQNATVLMLADIGRLAEASEERVATWVRRGGVLVRFAGQRLERGGDSLLPVVLREGGRALGGALSWSTPQALSPFAENSLFAGLPVPEDVRVRRQVLAEPASMDADTLVWARLADGTPLVTARREGNGHIVLFHITANSDWSNLPLSGLFVEMLRRIATLGANQLQVGNESGGTETAASATGTTATGAADDDAVLAPIRVLDGYGALAAPPPTAESVSVSAFETLKPQLKHPPGYYRGGTTQRALNVINRDTVLAALPSLPSGAQSAAYGGETRTDIKPWLLGAALLLLFLDVIAIMLLQSNWRPRRAPAATASAVAAAIGLALVAGLMIGGASPASAQSSATPEAGAASATAPKPADGAKFDPRTALAATSKVTFGYVLTGDAGLDATSKAGLEGLVKVLTARTAIEPGPPFGVTIESDEISFFPILYWPVSEQTKELSEPARAKIDAYMKRGGMIIFDTRDHGQGMPLGFAQQSGNRQSPLQRVLAKLDIPRLEPVPEGHVLTKSFYLISTFPGRWDGGELWVEATAPAAANGGQASRQARRADGVSSILITANDFASAWALDPDNRPLFPVVPGGERQREWAFRTGVNIAMYALTGNYKADQVHVPSLLQRLGQ
ncbi:MAG: DUF4159 domain-containing protein [Pseudomonadota bacterium]